VRAAICIVPVRLSAFVDAPFVAESGSLQALFAKINVQKEVNSCWDVADKALKTHSEENGPRGAVDRLSSFDSMRLQEDGQKNEEREFTSVAVRNNKGNTGLIAFAKEGNDGILNTMRFILRYKKRESIPPSEIEKVEQLADITIVDRASRMLLVETSKSTLGLLQSRLVASDWFVSEEQEYEIPDTRPKPRSA
jgi:hypothetical protein